MNNELLKYFEEIDARQKGVEKAQTFLDEERKKYEEKVNPVQSFIERENIEIEQIKNKQIGVDFSKALEELAKLWGTRVEDLELDFSTSAKRLIDRHSDTVFGGVLSIDQRVLFAFLEGKYDKKHEYQITVVDKKTGQETLFVSKLDRNSIQADGKPLKEHLYQTSEKCDNSSSSVLDFKVDKYENLRLYYDIKKLYSLNRYTGDTIDWLVAIRNSFNEKSPNQENTEMAK